MPTDVPDTTFYYRKWNQSWTIENTFLYINHTFPNTQTITMDRWSD